MKCVCVDACVVIKWLTPEEGSEQALELLSRWQSDGVTLIAPSLLDYELGSVLRRKVIRGLIDSRDVYPIVELYEKLEIQLFHLTRLIFQTLAVADTLQQPTIYDVSYLMTAKQQNTTLVTADHKFYTAANQVFGDVRYFEDLL